MIMFSNDIMIDKYRNRGDQRCRCKVLQWKKEDEFIFQMISVSMLHWFNLCKPLVL